MVGSAQPDTTGILSFFENIKDNIYNDPLTQIAAIIVIVSAIMGLVPKWRSWVLGFFKKKKIDKRKVEQLKEVIEFDCNHKIPLNAHDLAEHIVESGAWRFGSVENHDKLDITVLSSMGRRTLKQFLSDLQTSTEIMVDSWEGFDFINYYPVDQLIVGTGKYSRGDRGSFLNSLFSKMLEAKGKTDFSIIDFDPKQKDLNDTLKKGSRFIILSAYLDSEDLARLEQRVNRIKAAHTNAPCKLVGGFILFTEESVDRDRLYNMFEEHDQLCAPFIIDLGKR